MYANNGKISSRQTLRLYVFDLIGIGTLLIPPYLARLSGSDGIAAILIACLIGYGYLRYLGFIIAKMDTDIGSYLEQSTSKWVQKVSFAFVFIHCCLTAGFAVYVFCNLMQYSLVKEVEYLLLLFVTVVVAAYSVSGGIENRARIYEVLFWIILIPYTVMMFMSIKDFEPVYVNHFWESRPLDLVKSIYLVFLFLTPLFFTLFLLSKKEDTKYGRNMIRTVSQALVTGGIILVGSYIILLGNFGQRSLANLRFPVVTLMSMVQLKGNFLKRMDALMLAVWFFTLFAFLNLHMHYGTAMLKKLTGKAKRWEVMVLAVAAFGVAWFLKNSTTGVCMFLDYYSYVAVPLMIIGPGLILYSGKMKKQIAVILIFCMTQNLSACQATELKNRCFPMMVAVDYDGEKEQVLFYESFPDSQSDEGSGASVNEIQVPLKKGKDFEEAKETFEGALSKVVDYNHLKVIIVGKKLVENENAFYDMLKHLAQTEEFPRNTYVCITEDVEEMLKIKEKLPQEMGTFLEEYLENHEKKKKGLISLGDILDEQENKALILYAPYLNPEDSGVKWQGYYTIPENKKSAE